MQTTVQLSRGPDSTGPDSTGPFHEGETAVQARMGVRGEIEPWARQVVRPYLSDQHRTFYAQLPFLVSAARDSSGRPWATLLTGSPGFVDSPDAHSLTISAEPVAGDALHGLSPGAAIGLLGIDFATRRRNRVNGKVVKTGPTGLTLTVDQSFGNCPQYIGGREWASVDAHRTPVATRHQRATAPMREWIEKADTFFIASGYDGPAVDTPEAPDLRPTEGSGARFGMDASHRGGQPGFVRFSDDRTLTWPDYAGNNHFNTIGNLVMDARVGLLFVDFEQGHLLQVSGTASIDWDSPAVSDSKGARRLVSVTIEAIVELRHALPIRWQSTAGSLRSLRLSAKCPESEDVSSFVFIARDGGELADFESGQHLPIEVAIPGLASPALRTYSLSAAPDGQAYRLTVKRDADGLVSRYLHDALTVGDFIDARTPDGDFVLQPGSRPVVLVSAGVGLTPMVSMLQVLSGEDSRRETWFIHGARNGAHHPLRAEVAALVASGPHLRQRIAYSQPGNKDVLGQDFHHHGRVDGKLLADMLPSVDADYYLCGPLSFMSAIHQDLTALGVRPSQIHHETFGPQA